MRTEAAPDPFPRYAAWVVAAGAVGLLGAWGLPRTPPDRMGAFLGVAGSVLSGVVALTLKRRAMERSVQFALGMVGVVFALRLLLVAAGLGYVVSARLGTVAFVLGFFGEYFVLQFIEISYVLAETRRRGPGGE